MKSPDASLIATLNQSAASFYRESYQVVGAGPRAYLASRGLVEEFDRWEVGYAPRGWTALTGYLRAQGHTDATLLAAGLALTTRRGTVIDRFRDRVMLPVRGMDGQVAGFLGRAAPQAGCRVPKYLNSPRTALYDKSRLLFGLHEQQSLLRGDAIPVVVEGPFDVLAIRALPVSGGGFAATALCGTAMTVHQAAQLRGTARSETVVVALDADEPGRLGALAAYQRLRPHFNDVRAAALSPGLDPAALIAHPSALTDALVQTVDLADRLVDSAVAAYRLDNAEARACALHAGTAVISSLAAADVPRQVSRISRALDFPVAVVTEDLLAAVARAHLTSTSRQHQPALHRAHGVGQRKSAQALP